MTTERSLEVTGVDRVDHHHVLVEFSDGTSSTFSIDQLLSLNPLRMPPKDGDQ